MLPVRAGSRRSGPPLSDPGLHGDQPVHPEGKWPLPRTRPEHDDTSDAGQPALATERGVTEDLIAMVATLAQPWVSVVPSGTVTSTQLEASPATLTVGELPALRLAQPRTRTGGPGG